MGHQIIKQPNGLLGIFSDSVDYGAWLRWDMTPKQVKKYYARRAAKEAKESVGRVLEHVLADEPREAYYQFAYTFAEANAHAKLYHPNEGPEGPVDEKVLEDLRHPEPGVTLGIDGEEYDDSEPGGCAATQAYGATGCT